MRAADGGDALYQLFTELPVHLRTRLTEERQQAALRALPLLSGVPQLAAQYATRRALAAASLPMRLTAGHELKVGGGGGWGGWGVAGFMGVCVCGGGGQGHAARAARRAAATAMWS